MTCQICNAPRRVTDPQKIQEWGDQSPYTLHWMGGSNYYEAARNARTIANSWGGIWTNAYPCNFCIDEPVRQPSPPPQRAPSPPRPPPLPKPKAEDIRQTARRLSEQAQQQDQGPSGESLADKLKRTMRLSGDAASGASSKLKSVVEAGQQTLRDQIDARTRAAQEFAQAGERMAHNVAEAGRDAAHSLRTAGEDIAFAYQQESRIRNMCREQTYEAGFRCAANISDSVTNANIDDAINLAADVAIAGATRSYKNFMKAESIRGIAAVLKRPDCREFIRGSVSNECVDRVLPNGYVNVSTDLPRRQPEGN